MNACVIGNAVMPGTCTLTLRARRRRLPSVSDQMMNHAKQQGVVSQQFPPVAWHQLTGVGPGAVGSCGCGMLTTGGTGGGGLAIVCFLSQMMNQLVPLLTTVSAPHCDRIVCEPAPSML